MRALFRILPAIAVLVGSLWFLGDVLVWKGALSAKLSKSGELVVADLPGGALTAEEVQEALRAELWRRGEVWGSLDKKAQDQRRKRVLERLIDNHLVRFSRKSEIGRDAAPIVKEVMRESELQRRQVATSQEYHQRLALQRHTSETLAAEIQEACLDEAWLEEKLKDPEPEVLHREVKNEYERVLPQLRIPPAFHVAHIFIPHSAKGRIADAERLARIREQLSADPQQFAAVARKVSEDSRSRPVGGDLGWLTRGRSPDDFIDQVEQVPVGALSAPFSTKLGWHVVLVLERQTARLPALGEVWAELAAKWRTRTRTARLEFYLAELRRVHEPRIYKHDSALAKVRP